MIVYVRKIYGIQILIRFHQENESQKKIQHLMKKEKNLKVSNRIIMKPRHENYTFQDKMVPKRKHNKTPTWKMCVKSLKHYHFLPCFQLINCGQLILSSKCKMKNQNLQKNFSRSFEEFSKIF